MGTSSATIKSLHDKYGEVVRVSPKSLSFASGQAWRGMSIISQLTELNLANAASQTYMDARRAETSWRKTQTLSLFSLGLHLIL